MRSITFAVAILALAVLPSTYAVPDAVTSGATTSTAPPATMPTAATGTLYQHRDCVGPGLPGTAGPHVDHTTNVPGVGAGNVIHFQLTPISLIGSPGPCPVTAADVGVLPEDFTGRYHLVAVRRGNLNPGTVMLDWTVDAVAGLPLQQAAGGTGCSANFGSTFSLDVTVSISSTNFLGVTLPPTGAVELAIS